MIDLGRYGPWAVIPGGSEAIGAACAHRLGEAGFNLVLIARKPGPLEEVAHDVRARHGVEVRTLSLDLTRPDLLDAIRPATDDVEVGLLAYIAGANHRTGELLGGTLDDALRLVRVNAIGQTTLCYHFGQKMVARGRGGIIIAGSLVGTAGSAHVVTYAASKAYSQNFAEGLWWEFKQHGVDVVYVAFGATATPAMVRMGIKFPPGEAADPDEMAKLALANIANGPVCIPDHIVEAFNRFSSMPRREAAEAMASFVVTRTPDG